jgi:hypothetical protein
LKTYGQKSALKAEDGIALFAGGYLKIGNYFSLIHSITPFLKGILRTNARIGSQSPKATRPKALISIRFLAQPDWRRQEQLLTAEFRCSLYMLQPLERSFQSLYQPHFVE